MLCRFVLVALVVAALVSVPLVGGQGEQTWYFTNTDASSPTYSGANYNKIMYRGVEGGDVKITLAPGERVWFYADELAQCDVSFPAGNWDVAYWVRAVEAGESGTVYTRVCYLDYAGSYERVGYASAKISHSTEIEEIVETPSTSIFTIPKDGRLAVEVYWGSSPSGDLEIHCNPTGKHASSLTCPVSDPAYPVPEFSTLVLFSTGLLTLVGYCWLLKIGRRG